MTDVSGNARLDEKTLILTLGLIQFVNILDFVMVMPLGPDLAAAIDMPLENIGYIGGAYTFSAGIVGLIAALYLDALPRKFGALFFLFGLALATVAGAFVTNETQLLITRLAAGAFGGPLTALAHAIIADCVPPERRGKAVGKITAAFAVASVVGVPFGLEVSARSGAHSVFLVTGILCFVVMAIAYFKLPEIKISYHAPATRVRLLNLLKMARSALPLRAYGLIALATFSSFTVIPHIATHFIVNLHYPRDNLGLLYLIGGVITFFSMRMAGDLVDKIGVSITSAVYACFMAVSLLSGFIFYPSFVPTSVVFICFMVAGTGRSVCLQTFSSKIPAPHERGAFMSLNNAIMHFGSSLGAYLSSLILFEEAGRLENIAEVSSLSLVITALIPLFLYMAEKKTRLI